MNWNEGIKHLRLISWRLKSRNSSGPKWSTTKVIEATTQTTLASTLATPLCRVAENADQWKCDVNDRTWNAANAMKKILNKQSRVHNNHLFLTYSPFFISKGFTGHVWRSWRSIQSDPFPAYITSSSLRCFPYVPSTLACMVIISARCLHNIVYLSSPRATSSTNRGPVSAEEPELHQARESLAETPRSAMLKKLREKLEVRS